MSMTFRYGCWPSDGITFLLRNTFILSMSILFFDCGSYRIESHLFDLAEDYSVCIHYRFLRQYRPFSIVNAESDQFFNLHPQDTSSKTTCLRLLSLPSRPSKRIWSLLSPKLFHRPSHIWILHPLIMLVFSFSHEILPNFLSFLRSLFTD